MPDTEIGRQLQAVLDEVCPDIPAWDTTTRERVAEILRAAVRQDLSSSEDLKRAGQDALTRAPTMWR